MAACCRTKGAVLGGKRRFHIEKGRYWSLVEHLLLEVIARNPSSAAKLARKAKCRAESPTMRFASLAPACAHRRERPRGCNQDTAPGNTDAPSCRHLDLPHTRWLTLKRSGGSREAGGGSTSAAVCVGVED